MSDLKKIPIHLIRENPNALRQVNRTTDPYRELVDSVRKVGILNSISVREIKDPDTGNVLYGLIDGLHRFSAGKDAGLSEIPCQVISMADGEIMEAQIIANAHKVETKPFEYSKQLVRILAGNPMLLIRELAVKLAKSPKWLEDVLGLDKLPDSIGKLVDEGRMPLSNGYMLAKLAAVAEGEVPNYLDRAMTQNPSEFMPMLAGRVKEIKDAKRQGRTASPEEFVAHPVLRKLGEIKDEMSNPQIGPVLVKELKVKDPVEAFNLGIKWALKMDPATVQIRKQTEEDRQKAMKAEAEKRKVDREAEKARVAREEAILHV